MQQLELVIMESCPPLKPSKTDLIIKDIELRLRFNKKKKEIKAFIDRDPDFKHYLLHELRGMLKNTLKIYREYNTDGALVPDDIDILSYRALNCIVDPCYLNEENYRY